MWDSIIVHSINTIIRGATLFIRRPFYFFFLPQYSLGYDARIGSSRDFAE